MSRRISKSFKKMVKIVIYIPLFVLWYGVISILPYKLQMLLGSKVGMLAQKLSKRRRTIASTNIALCFPELSEQEQQKIYNDSMASLGKGFMESGIAWFWPNWRLKNLCHIKGLEHLENAKQENQGVLFLAIHFTPIEICAALLNMRVSIDGFYRRHKNPIYEFIQCKGRTRRNKQSRVIPKNDARGIVRPLRNKRIVNYAADQDFGRRHSIFAPFFGISTATVTAPVTLAKLGNAQIIPYTTRRLDNNEGYEIQIYPRLDIGCSDDPLTGTCTINDFIEARIRENPGQYLWVHRRFKTRPQGEDTLYSQCCRSSEMPDFRKVKV